MASGRADHCQFRADFYKDSETGKLHTQQEPGNKSITGVSRFQNNDRPGLSWTRRLSFACVQGLISCRPRRRELFTPTENAGPEVSEKPH